MFSKANGSIGGEEALATVARKKKTALHSCRHCSKKKAAWASGYWSSGLRWCLAVEKNFFTPYLIEY
jgi:hypothetical protein